MQFGAVNGSVAVCTNKATDKQAVRTGGKKGRDESQGESREGSRGSEPGRQEMMNHYKGKEKSKWK